MSLSLKIFWFDFEIDWQDWGMFQWTRTCLGLIHHKTAPTISDSPDFRFFFKSGSDVACQVISEKKRQIGDNRQFLLQCEDCYSLCQGYCDDELWIMCIFRAVILCEYWLWRTSVNNKVLCYLYHGLLRINSEFYRSLFRSLALIPSLKKNEHQIAVNKELKRFNKIISRGYAPRLRLTGKELSIPQQSALGRAMSKMLGVTDAD